MKKYFFHKSSDSKRPLAHLLGSGIFIALALKSLSIFSGLAGIFSGFLKITWQKIEIQREIDKLKTETGKLEADNKYLSGILDYIGSDSFKEREMRLKLNLQKEGEKVIIIYDESGALKTGQNSAKESENSTNRQNYKKWWDYFFGKK